MQSINVYLRSELIENYTQSFFKRCAKNWRNVQNCASYYRVEYQFSGTRFIEQDILYEWTSSLVQPSSNVTNKVSKEARSKSRKRRYIRDDLRLYKYTRLVFQFSVTRMYTCWYNCWYIEFLKIIHVSLIDYIIHIRFLKIFICVKEGCQHTWRWTGRIARYFLTCSSNV